eukprot:120198-Chlamydomonas_euryale.AAC.2
MKTPQCSRLQDREVAGPCQASSIRRAREGRGARLLVLGLGCEGHTIPGFRGCADEDAAVFTPVGLEGACRRGPGLERCACGSRPRGLHAVLDVVRGRLAGERCNKA